MPTVTLTLDGSAPTPAALPRRLRLSRAATELLAGTTGTPLPWGRTGLATDLAQALGGPVPAEAPGADAEHELLTAGLVRPDGTVHPDVEAALATFGRPEVFVDLTLSLARGGHVDQLEAWHRLSGGRVTTLAATGGACELAWYDVRWWHPALTALAARPQPDPTRPAPRPDLVLPLELMLGSGHAHRTGRQDVLAELLGRYGDAVSADGRRLGDAETREELRTLHDSAQGRLRVVVAGAERRTLGLVSWVLFADGWRELEPRRAGGPPLVAVSPVRPEALGARVARLVTAVRP